MRYVSNIREAFTSRTLPTALALLKDLDTPRALAVYMLANTNTEEAWDTIFNLSVSPSNYLASEDDLFARDYTATKLLQKIPNFLNRDLKAKALESFSEAEYQCWLLNRDVLSGQISFDLREKGLPSLATIKKKVSKVLGRAPSWQTVLECGGWGPGSSYALSQRKASPELKCEYENTATLKLLQALRGVILPRWFEGKPFQLVPGNLVTTTPKNAKTDRTIAIEPGLNGFVQKGIGACIRRRLRRFGINLNDQSINQIGAMLAMDLQLSTLDLKAASDSISWALCEAILPKDWLDLIAAARSERGTFDSRSSSSKQWFEYQKVSSMGNGFTFELESTIFFSVLLACGVPERECYVYGDDIIVPRTFSTLVIDTLAQLGFSTNIEKSFVDGLFFESCGVHVFNGIDVTPVQIKDMLHGPKDVIVLANKLRLFAHSRNYHCGCDRRYLPSYRLCTRWLPPSILKRCRGPVAGGLTLFATQEEAACSTYNRRRAAFSYHQLVPVIDRQEADFPTLLFYRLWQLESTRESNLHEYDKWSEVLASARGNTVKQSLVKYRTARCFQERWITPGNWQ